MFNDIQAESAQRLTEIREHLEFIGPLIPAAPIRTPRHLNTAKGLMFVQLYGLIEYTVCNTIAKTILHINGESLKLSEIKPVIFGLALNPELDALIQTNAKKWSKREDLFQRLNDDSVVNIASNLMPTDGGNIQSKQLESIWHTFCLDEPIFHDVSFRGRLVDIVTLRIAIAHGNESASSIGSRVTVDDLTERINDVSAFCSYVISIFEDYVKHKRFKK
jgi:hypothetical protein